jgi:hypothetical protein
MLLLFAGLSASLLCLLHPLLVAAQQQQQQQQPSVQQQRQRQQQQQRQQQRSRQPAQQSSSGLDNRHRIDLAIAQLLGTTTNIFHMWSYVLPHDPSLAPAGTQATQHLLQELQRCGPFVAATPAAAAAAAGSHDRHGAPGGSSSSSNSLDSVQLYFHTQRKGLQLVSELAIAAANDQLKEQTVERVPQLVCDSAVSELVVQVLAAAAMLMHDEHNRYLQQ